MAELSVDVSTTAHDSKMLEPEERVEKPLRAELDPDASLVTLAEHFRALTEQLQASHLNALQKLAAERLRSERLQHALKAAGVSETNGLEKADGKVANGTTINRWEADGLGKCESLDVVPTLRSRENSKTLDRKRTQSRKSLTIVPTPSEVEVKEKEGFFVTLTKTFTTRLSPRKRSSLQESPQGSGQLPPVSPAGTGTSGTTRHSGSSTTNSPKCRHDDVLPFAQNNGMTTEEMGRRYYMPKLMRFVRSNYFEGFFCVLIALNALIIAADAQYQGWQVGYDIGYPTSTPAEEDWPQGHDFFEACSWFFGICFVVEIVLKLIALRSQFTEGGWNVFDMLIAILWILEASRTLGNFVNPTLLRIIRLVKLLRLVRLVRTIQAFDALYLMTTALAGSATILAWSALLLIVLLMMFALFVNQVLVETYLQKQPPPPEEELLAVYEYFGTFSRSLLSMFEMTLANWPPVCRLLVENVSELYLIPALIHKLTIGFAVVGVINGVFMQETFKVASTDDSIMLRQKMNSIRMHKKKMRALFAALDDSEDGVVDLEEFREVTKNQQIMTWLASMDLEAQDVETLFELIDESGDGEITADELIHGVNKLKGNARSIDLAITRRDQQRVLDAVEHIIEALCAVGIMQNSKCSAVPPAPKDVVTVGNSDSNAMLAMPSLTIVDPLVDDGPTKANDPAEIQEEEECDVRMAKAESLEAVVIDPDQYTEPSQSRNTSRQSQLCQIDNIIRV